MQCIIITHPYWKQHEYNVTLYTHPYWNQHEYNVTLYIYSSNTIISEKNNSNTNRGNYVNHCCPRKYMNPLLFITFPARHNYTKAKYLH